MPLPSQYQWHPPPTQFGDWGRDVFICRTCTMSYGTEHGRRGGWPPTRCCGRTHGVGGMPPDRDFSLYWYYWGNRLVQFQEESSHVTILVVTLSFGNYILAILILCIFSFRVTTATFEFNTATRRSCRKTACHCPCASAEDIQQQSACCVNQALRVNTADLDLNISNILLDIIRNLLIE